jgi:hypothetical protein
MRRPGHSTAEAARLIAAALGLKEVTGLHAYRTAVKAKLLDHVSARGRSAPRVTSTETSIICLSQMSMSDAATNTSNVPNTVRRVIRLRAGTDPEICLMGDDQQPVAEGSFVEALTQAIERKVDPRKGPAQAFGLQFCKGEVRAWAEWERINGRVYFGVRELPTDDVIQEVRIGARVIDTLRQIAGTSTETEVPEIETTTPTQVRTGSAAVNTSSYFSPENRRDANREVPVVYAKHEHQDSRVDVKNQPDSGADSPSSNQRTRGRSSAYVHNPRNRCAQVA